MIRGSIQQENITVINTYAPNIGQPQYIKQVLTDIKGEMSNKITVRNFKTPPKSTDYPDIKRERKQWL